MRFTVTTNARDVQGVVEFVLRDQVPFALKSAINATAVEAQEAQRAHQREIFTIRRPRWVDRSVKIKPFASKARLFADIQIDPPGGAKRRDILTKFEDETKKEPTSGTRLAVPVDVRRTKAGVVSRVQRPSKLNFRPHGSSGRVMRGDKRTFMVREPGGRGAIFQRFGRRGKGKDNVRVLFVFAPSVPIEPELDFVDNVTRVVGERFDRNFDSSLDRAMSTARV